MLTQQELQNISSLHTDIREIQDQQKRIADDVRRLDTERQLLGEREHALHCILRDAMWPEHKEE